MTIRQSRPYSAARQMVRASLAAAVLLWSENAFACTTASPTSTPDLGSFSPAATKNGVVPVGTLSGGINCSGTAISLLGGNVLTATLGSTNGYKMTPIAGGEPVTFRIFVDAAATKPMSTTGATNFLDPQLIDLVGLLGNSPSNIPVYVKVGSANAVAPGTYTGSFSIAWNWKFCSVAWVGNNCTLGTKTQGTGTVTIGFTMTVAAKPVLAVVSSTTTWDPVTGTTNPNVLPRSKRRMTITLKNPDLVAVDAGSLVVDLPTPAKAAIALDGDGTGAAVIQTTPGGSGLTLSYTTPSATNDNVEFSSDNGQTFTYAPVAGDSASQAAITVVRFRPQGSMAAGSTYAISIPYAVQ